MYNLNAIEKQRLLSAVQANLAFPFIDDIEDYILEAIFCYVKQLPIVDPLTNTRSKRLFDVVDKSNHIGWSIKGLQCTTNPNGEFELVIQRADIFKKATALGFDTLTVNTDPAILGQALLKHWNDKITDDATFQEVIDKRAFILLKSRDRCKFTYIEEDLTIYEANQLTWQWTDSTKTGLQGRRISDNFCVYRWYPNQKQLFERFKINEDSFSFNITPKRLTADVVVQVLLSNLTEAPNIS